MKKLLTLAVVFAITCIACSKGTDNISTTVDCSDVSVSFVTQVSPLVQSTCATSTSCHATGSSNGPGALLSYQQIYNARTAIRIAVGNGIMPQNSSLSNTQKNIILCWIDNGATNN